MRLQTVCAVLAALVALAHSAFDAAWMPDAWALAACAPLLAVIAFRLMSITAPRRHGASSSAESVTGAGTVVYVSPVLTQTRAAPDYVSLLIMPVVVLCAAWLQSRRGGIVFATSVGAAGCALAMVDWFACLIADMQHERQPARGLVRRGAAAWLVLTLCAATLLALPAAIHPAVPDYGHNLWRHLSTCWFTAVSAATCNGAVIYDLHEELRPFGRGVFFVTMQLGGLLFVLFGWLAMRPWLFFAIRPRTVVTAWIGLQLAGTVVTWTQWSAPANTGDRAWWAFFNSAAAVNNAGTPLRQEGLSAYLGTHTVYWAMLVLSAVGAIGLAVVVDRVLAVWTSWFGRGGVPTVQTPARPHAPNRERQAHAVARPTRVAREAIFNLLSLELHTGLWLVCVAAAVVWIFERPDFMPPALVSSRPLYLGVQQRPLREMERGEAWRASLLASTAARSSGLRVAPLLEGAVTWPTWATLIALMVVGGGIGSAAGGLRVGSLVILAYRSALRGAGMSGWVDMAKRICLLVFALNLLAILTLALTQRWLAPQASASWWEIIFDATALVNGVGWSSGLTPHLSNLARLTMGVLMIAGKLGPLLGWCLVRNPKP